MSKKDKIDKEKLPKHVAIIMDGNGRWAKRRGNQRIFGHRNGVKAVRAVTEAAAELGMGFLTLYAFSTENWNRPKKEVDALMSLLVSTIADETPTLMKNNVKLNVIGCKDTLPDSVRANLEKCINNTKDNSGLVLTLALSYSARWEIIKAVQNILEESKNKNINVKDVDTEFFSNYLQTKNIPDPELLIRTSGEFRVSNFLLWQIAYTEFYFTETLWPDFSKEEFYKAILSYQNRERRFGKTSDQLN